MYQVSGFWKIGFLSECLSENRILQIIISATVGGIIGSIITKVYEH
jgi:hypothetical protein